jgi:hypothetical protein
MALPDPSSAPRTGSSIADSVPGDYALPRPGRDAPNVVVIVLDDVRRYREQHLAGTGIAPVFPLWGEPTDRLAREMLDAGVRAVLTCVDPTVLPASFAGRPFDADLLADLPQGVDPCGERGEFHTFVWDAPGFSAPVPVTVGEVIARDGFVFCDLTPASSLARDARLLDATGLELERVGPADLGGPAQPLEPPDQPR